jgi:phage-related protein
LEVVDDFESDTYRTVYTVRLRSGIYVLHCLPEEIETRRRDAEARR